MINFFNSKIQEFKEMLFPQYYNKNIRLEHYLTNPSYQVEPLPAEIDGKPLFITPEMLTNQYRGMSKFEYIYTFLTWGFDQDGFTLEQLAFNLFAMAYEFVVLKDALKITLSLTGWILAFAKLAKLMSRFFAYEKSKKLFFGVYIIAVSYIIPYSIMLLCSYCDGTSTQGILVLYVYMTATLMLFLIFLALTTCESYLNKDSDFESPLDTPGWSVTLFKLILYSYPAFYVYYVFIYDLALYYTLKYKVWKISDIKNSTLYERNLMDGIKPLKKIKVKSVYIPDGRYSMRLEYIIEYGEKPSTFELLKKELRDSYLGYFLSALIQTAALIIIILALII